MKRVKLYSFLRKHATGQATTELHIVHVERGMSWEGAVEKSAEAKLDTEGFYLSHQVKNCVIYYLFQCWYSIGHRFYSFWMFISAPRMITTPIFSSIGNQNCRTLNNLLIILKAVMISGLPFRLVKWTLDLWEINRFSILYCLPSHLGAKFVHKFLLLIL